MTIEAEPLKPEEPEFFTEALSANDPIGALRMKLLNSILEHAKEHQMHDSDVLAVLGNIAGTIRFYAEGAGMTMSQFNEIMFLNVDSAYSNLLEQERVAASQPKTTINRIARRVSQALKRKK